MKDWSLLEIGRFKLFIKAFVGPFCHRNIFYATKSSDNDKKNQPSKEENKIKNIITYKGGWHKLEEKTKIISWIVFKVSNQHKR